ncbi:MAG TPA: hypothetical protein DEA96_00830, partial [Leptospiraceae bacterium]|nr:hypothetical protein [Leptospiraceae bacterium]
MRRVYLLLLIIPTILLADSEGFFLPPLELASRAHLEAPNLDEDDYESALHIFINQLDPRRIIFTEKDIESIQDAEEKYRGRASIRFL